MPVLSAILAAGADAHHHDHHNTSFEAAPAGENLEFREYYAEACPHCKNLDPAWQAAAAKASASGAKVTFRQIQCNDANWMPVKENEKLCEGIAGFPTMKMFKGDKELQEYMGGRSTSDLLDYVTNFDETKVAENMMPLGALALARYMMSSQKQDDETKRMEEYKAFL